MRACLPKIHCMRAMMRVKTSKTLALCVLISILLLIVNQKVNQLKRQFPRVKGLNENLSSAFNTNNKPLREKKTFDGRKWLPLEVFSSHERAQ